MKKIIALVLVFILLLAMGCSAESMAGGWNLPEDNTVTSDVQAVFEKATSELVGCSYEPVAVLGTQVVAGINYVILAKITPVYPGAEAHYALVYIYADLTGNATVTSIADFSIEPEIEEESRDEDGQNPVMNLIGGYMDKLSERASMVISCVGEDEADITITWANSASETVVWHMSGHYDIEAGLIEYEDCVKTVETYDANGNCTCETVYENGTGTLFVSEDWNILWQDDQNEEVNGVVCEFEFVGSTEG